MMLQNTFLAMAASGLVTALINSITFLTAAGLTSQAARLIGGRLQFCPGPDPGEVLPRATNCKWSPAHLHSRHITR